MPDIKKYLSLERLTEYDTLIKAKIDSDIESHTHSWDKLEDKPFGEIVSAKQVEVYNQSLYFQDPSYDDRSDAYKYDTTDWLVEGENYIVNWDGETYYVTCHVQEAGKYGAGALYIGDIDYDWYPFFIGNNGYFRTNDTTSKYRQVIVYQRVYEETQLDEKYIPDTIARTQYVDENFALKSDLNNIDLSEYETKENAQTKYDELNEAIAGKADVADAVQSDWSVNDENDPAYVKDRTHYYITKGFKVEWDGDTSKIDTAVTVGGDGGFYHVSDLIPSNEELRLSKVTVSFDSTGESIQTVNVSDLLAQLGQNAVMTEDFATISYVTVVRVDNYTYSQQGMSITFPKAGIYFVNTGLYTMALELPSQVEPLPEEFLPESAVRAIGQPTNIMNVIISYGNSSSEYVLDKTFAEIYQANRYDGAYVFARFANSMFWGAYNLIEMDNNVITFARIIPPDLGYDIIRVNNDNIVTRIQVDSLVDGNNEIKESLSNKANISDIPTGALADKDVVSESDLDSALAEKVNAASEGNHSHLNKTVLDGITSAKVTAWDSSLDEAKTYTDTKTNGMATTTVVDNKITAHNSSTSAHSDIRDLITGLTTRLNTLADSDDTTLDQMSELVAYIKSNKSLIDGITTSKVNVSDIVDNLTTNVANKPLSAAQGVAIKALIDALQTAVDGKANSGHNHDDRYYTESEIDTKIAAINTAINGKANETHSHAISEVTNLQSALDAKASQTSLDTHTGNTTVHITSTERTNWNAAKTHADSAHAPSNAQANVIESIKVNGAVQTITSKSVNITVPTDNASLTNGAGYLVASDIANKANKATTLSGYGITDAYTKTEVDAKTVVDSALSSSSTNPVQNKVVNSAISTLTSAVSTNTSSINSHNTAISNLQTAMSEIQEITSEEIQSLFQS